MKAVLKAFRLLVAIMTLVSVVTFIWIGSRGISAKAQPGRAETAIARTMRRLAIPRSARNLTNPVARSPDVLAEGMAHYADHCAACHANEGHAHKVMGTVSSIDGRNLMVTTTDGKTVMVMLDAKTRIMQGKSKVELAALKVGDRVVAEGTEDKGMISATTVKLGEVPAPTAKK